MSANPDNLSSSTAPTGTLATMRERKVGTVTIRVVQEDLTAQDVDAVVNAANEYLKHGGGLAAAIVRAGGHSIQDASDRWVAEHGPLRRGVAAITPAGKLAARFVVHTVGPRYLEGQDNEALLREAVAAALSAAVAAGAKSIALPAISSGIFGYPAAEAAAVIAAEVVAWIENHPGSLSEVRLIGYNEASAADFEAGLAETVGPPPSSPH